MKAILSLSKARIISSLRDKSTIFWSVFFPIVLLVIMIAIFSNVYSSNNSINFTFAVINNSKGMWSSIVVNVSKDMAKSKTFSLKSVSTLDKAKNQIREGKLDCLIFIPKGFDLSFLNKTIPLKIYYNKNESTSKMAKNIINSIVLTMNLEVLKHIGKKINLPKTRIIYINQKKSLNFNVTDYFFSGIMIMAILTIGSFNVPISLIWEKRSGITKRLLVTPVKSITLFISIINEFLMLALIQFILLSSISIFIYNGSIYKIFSFATLYYVLLTSAISISMGFFIASVSKTVGTANAIGNLIFFPFQFLGGLYFPTLNVSQAIKWMVIGNPITYIAAGMRESMGVMPNPFSISQTVLIPLIWFLFFSITGLILYKRSGENI